MFAALRVLSQLQLTNLRDMTNSIIQTSKLGALLQDWQVTLHSFSSVQFKMVSMCSEKPICAPPRLSEVFPPSPFKWFQSSTTDNGPLSSFQGKSSSASSFHASLLQAIDGVMSLVLCPKVVSHAPQHFTSSEKQATCEGCFPHHSICPVISLHSGTCIYMTV